MPRQPDERHLSALEALNASIGKIPVTTTLKNDLAYEFTRYCNKMQLTKSEVMRIALVEYLEGRGIRVTGGTQG